MFKINDYVYYGSGGICRIDDICTEPFEGAPADVRYYVLHTLCEPRQTIWNPVDNDRVLMRSVMTEEEFKALFAVTPSLTYFEEPSTKQLRERYIGAIKSGDPKEWMRVLRTYNERCRLAASALVRVTDAEHNFYDTARRALAAELALCLSIPQAEAEERIAEIARVTCESTANA